jgi:hypothetical protein
VLSAAGRGARLRRLGWLAGGGGLAALLLGLALAPAGPPPPGRAIRGAALGLFATDPAYDYRVMVGEIADRGATDLLVVVPLVQSGPSHHDLAWVPGTTPHLDNVRRTVRQARDRDLRVGILPIVRLAHRRPDEWRGVIRPEAGVDAWFKAYATAIEPLVALAAEEEVVRLGLGSELSSLEGHEAHWRALAARVRDRYDGRLFYAVNWDRTGEVGFWDAVDEVGISGYFELAPPGEDPDDAALARAWVAPRRTVAELARTVDKPVFFAEIGYPAHRLAAARPWDHVAEAELDVALQARLWGAFCEAFRAEPAVEGFYAWNWFGHGGPRDRSYSPRGKPTAAVLARCWAELVRPLPEEPT